MRQPFAKPKLKEIESVSPSSLFTLVDCKLKFILDASNPYELWIPDATAILGSISHKLIELAARGTLENFDLSHIYSRWDDIVREQEADLAKTEIGKRILPLSNSHRRYGEIRRNTCNQSNLLASFPRAEVASEGQTERRYGSELPIVVNNPIKVKGKVDWVGILDGKLVIRDWKTGSVLDEDGEILGRYRTQMLAYAWMYHKKFNQWADCLEVCTIGAPARVIHFSPDEAVQHIESLLGIVSELNARLAEITAHPDRFAAPQTTPCNLCKWKLRCNAYWNDSDALNPREFQGVLVGAETGAFKTRVLTFTRCIDQVQILLKNVTTEMWNDPISDVGKTFRVCGCLEQGSGQMQLRTTSKFTFIELEANPSVGTEDHSLVSEDSIFAS